MDFGDEPDALKPMPAPSPRPPQRALVCVWAQGGVPGLCGSLWWLPVGWCWGVGFWLGWCWVVLCVCWACLGLVRRFGVFVLWLFWGVGGCIGFDSLARSDRKLPMMMLLHSVWSGGEGAAGRRRSLIALGALLALVGSVLFWAPESRAQNESPPVAIATVSVTTQANPTADPPTPAQATLVGSLSFDGDDTTGGISAYSWEVVTETYSWLQLDTRSAATTTFTVPSASLAARYGQSIEFRLTVTDNDTPAATDSTTVTFNINQGPTADIAVSAMLADPANPDVANHDDNGNGQRDENAERFPLDGVIDGPGENGNADNEWDIAEGALITLDGSGSSDPNGPIGATSHVWARVFVTPDTSYEGTPSTSLPNDGGEGSSQTGAANGKVMISTDEAPGRVPRSDGLAETMDMLRAVNSSDELTGQPAAPFYVYYRLTVSDGAGGSGSAVVKLVIHDRPADPTVDSLVASVPATGAAPGSAVTPAGKGRYVVAPGSSVLLTATASDADQDDEDPPAVSWEGAQATGAGALTANFQAPAGAEDGEEFTVTATATDHTGRTGSSSVVLVVAANTGPEAVAPGTVDATGLYSVITVADGSNGGDVVNGRGTGRVSLRGIGFDADGDGVSYAWTEFRMVQDADSSPTAQLPAFSTDADDCPDGFTDDADDDGTDDRCPVNLPVPIKPPAEARISIDMATTANASFAVPEVTEDDTANIRPIDHDGDAATATVPALHVPISFTVTDSRGVSDTQYVIVRIIDTDDAPVAAAGPDQQVKSGAFVRLNGAASSDADPGDRVSYQWSYVGIETDPATDRRAPVTAAEQGYGYTEGQWFPYDGKDGLQDSSGNACVGADGEAGTSDDIANCVDVVEADALPDDTYEHYQDSDTDAATPANDDAVGACTPTGGEAVTQVAGDGVLDVCDTNGDEPRFDADDTAGDADDARSGEYHPTAGGKLRGPTSAFPYFDAPSLGGFNSIKLTFRLVVADTSGDDSEASFVTVTIADDYYSGVITGPDFCTNDSLGGPRTYPLDRDRDGVADLCSLNDTRRGTVARQNALETLAALNQDAFKDALYGKADGSTRGTCDSAPTNLGDDTADKLAADSCGPIAKASRTVSSPPAPVDPAEAAEFFSGIITGPSFCANFSLGGARTYPRDLDKDGVADICSLAFTRREAVARQNALETFTGHDQYAAALAAACTALGSTSFEGDEADKLASDACNPRPAATLGDPLPTSS